MSLVGTIQSEIPRLRGEFAILPLSIRQFERINALGILREDDPVELLKGYMVAIDRGGGPGAATAARGP